MNLPERDEKISEKERDENLEESSSQPEENLNLSEEISPKDSLQETSSLSNKDISTVSLPKEERLHWYVVRVQSGKEDKVKASLENRVVALGMQDKIQEIQVPTELISDIRKGSKKRVIEKKLYPGYIMVYMIKNEDTHYMLKSTPGIGEFAGMMTQEEVDQMKASCGHTKDKPKPKVSFYKGESIKIKEGAFENYKGIVDEINEQKGIVKVRIKIFGRFTQIELGYWQVESSEADDSTET